LGSTKSHKVDVKIIAAANTDLRYLVEARQFREDLFHRLNVLSVRLPPLRERKEDILLLAVHFLKVYAKEYGRDAMGLGHSAKARLMGYAWPGNVRELEGVMHRAVAVAEEDMIEAEALDLPDHEMLDAPGPTMTLISRGQIPEGESFQSMKEKVIEEFERAYLSDLLMTHQGNVSKAARAAKKERRAFQRLLQKHGLNRRVFSAA
jgi:DNA-binding NtrC family response regulator